MRKINKKTISICLVLVLLGNVLIFSTQARAAAVIYDPLEMLNEFIVKPLVRKIANSLENKLVNNVNNLLGNINGKTPSFITNWRNYTLDSQARGNDVFRAVLADTRLCPYFDKELKFAFGAEKYGGVLAGAIVKNLKGQVAYRNKTSIPGLPSFQTISGCTLSSNFNVNTFRNDFSKGGGWAAWDQLIQPQNNFFGAFAMSLDEQQKQTAIEEQSARDESVAGRGFISQKLGLGNSGVGPTGCVSGATVAGAVGSNITRCTFLGKIVTPAEILGDTAANTLDTKLKRVGGATYLTDVVLSLFAAVINGTTNKLTNFIGQNTYDKLPGSSGGFSEQQFEPGVGDPNFTGDVTRARQGGQQGCTNACLQREESNCFTSDPAAKQQCENAAQSTCGTECGGI